MNLSSHSSPCYLYQTPYSYYFRIRIPDDLRLYFDHRHEIRRSLKTGYLSEAKHKARIIAGQIQKLFRYLRRKDYQVMSTKLTPQIISEIIAQFIEESLEEFEEEILDRKRTLTPKQLDDKAHGYSYVHSLKKEALATGDYKEAYHNADLLLDVQRIDVHKNSEDYRRLCREILKAQVKVLEQMEKRVYGNYDDEWTEKIQQQPYQPEPKTSDTIKQATDDYWNEYSGDIKPRSRVDYKGYLDHIVIHFKPETRLHEIEYTDVKAFRDGLKAGELSVSGKPLSVSRVNNYLGILVKIYALAMRKDKNLNHNPSEGLRLREKVRADQKRDVFTDEDLELIFVKSYEYGQDKHRNAHTFWIPLLGLYTGARLEEICQLLRTDVIQKDGIWCLNIDESDAPDIKSVKTSEQRIIPLHSFLVDDLRFIDYVHSLKKKDIRVFPKLKRVSNRWGHGFSQWFSQFKKRAGIESESGKKVFHSFRHTFIDHLKQKGANEQHVKEYVGHAGGDTDITWGLYGKQFKPQVLMDEVVLKLTYPVDLSHLKKSKFVPK